MQQQYKDQQELVDLQKELSRRQLAQYKKAEQLEEQQAKMLSKPAQGIGPVSTHQMVTRSITRQPTTNLGLRRFTGQVNMANLNDTQDSTPPRGMFENVNLNSPRNSLSVDGSFNSLLEEQRRLHPHHSRFVLDAGSDSSGSTNILVRRDAINNAIDPFELAQRINATRLTTTTQSVPNVAGIRK